MSRTGKTIESVIAEFIEACEREETPSPHDFLERYPEFASELADFFETHEHFASVAADGMQSSRSGSSLTATTIGHSSSLTSSVSLASNPPRFLGDYEILEEIDRGGMGVVYRARHQKLGRTVALKLIRSGELASNEEVTRFLSEAEAAAQLAHPGIVPIYEMGTMNGLVFYTMAYLEGQSLAEMIIDEPLDPLEAVGLVHKLCAAVQFAHEQGIYHRDLKPANVIVTESKQPVIIDFGLAKVERGKDAHLTATGQLLGTPAYMAPEVASGRVRAEGPAGDVYALGAILYCLCTGQAAFSGPTPFDVLLQVLDQRPPRPSSLNKRIPKTIDYVCLKTLEKDPKLRYGTAKELANDLQCILAEQPINCTEVSVGERLRNWWQREPILVAHIIGIDVTLAIVVLAYILRGEHYEMFYHRLALLSSWFLASFVLQRSLNFARWRSAAIYTWLTTDVIIYTSLISFAGDPRSMLLIGYPMMVAASALFYQRRYTITTTVLCGTGFLVLMLFFPTEEPLKPDFCAIFLSGLAVIGLCLNAMINRVRGLSRFHPE